MKQLILNPVENIPELFPVEKCRYMHGLYISDKYKDDEIVKNSKIGFSGRSDYSDKIHNIYDKWARLLGVEYLSMRLLSGLHAHIVLFMGLGKIGDTILLLPEIAGGHYATKRILERLGYHVIEMIPDCSKFSVDIEETRKLIFKHKPELIFVDRSEGLYYEDFTDLFRNIPEECGTIFDGSQYLTNILMEDFKSPFLMGFKIVMSTLHKNFPGPQKALVCSKTNNIYWDRIIDAVSGYVSNLHADNIYWAGQLLEYKALLRDYSRQMIQNSINLEINLQQLEVPVIQRDKRLQATHHIWIRPSDKEKAYEFYKKMEECGLLVNYRKLPYNIGYGIRMGTSAATLQGLNEENLPILSELIAQIYYSDHISTSLIHNVQMFLDTLVPMPQRNPLV